MKKSILVGIFICFFALLVSCSSGIKSDELEISQGINPPSWIIGTWTGLIYGFEDAEEPIPGIFTFDNDDCSILRDNEFVSFKKKLAENAEEAEEAGEDSDMNCISKTSSTLFVLTIYEQDEWSEKLTFTKTSDDTISYNYAYNKMVFPDDDNDDPYGSYKLTKQ